jgi:uncharacterized protein YggE
MAPLQINVIGTGSILRPAERAILVLQAYSPDCSTASEASAIVTLAANTIREAIIPQCPQDEATGQTMSNAAIAHYSMSTLDTNGRSRPIDDKKEKYETVYTASAQFHIKFADFNVLNALATEFSAMPTVKISKIEWHLTDAKLASIEGEARKLAAVDAIQRAHDFAEVFGGVEPEDLKKRVRAISVKENNYYQRDTRPQLHIGKRQMMGGIQRVGREELQFQPEDVRLTISVDGTFIVEA